jgi:hypothetical protein
MPATPVVRLPVASAGVFAAERDELALTAAGFPAFCVWRETIRGRTRYVARSMNLLTHPHTVVTPDLAELVAELVAGERPA